jgi:hypothetical protein
MKLFITLVATLTLALSACGGTEAEGELAETESAAYGACTAQMVRNEANLYSAYTGCTRRNPNTQATACASERNAWYAAWDAADAAGCWD